MGIILQFLLLISLLLILIKPSIGVCMYLAYYFLVPSMELNIIGLEATETSVLFVISFMLANKKNLKKMTSVDHSPLIPFFLLYSVLFILTFFSAQLVPWTFSLKNFLRHSILAFIIPTCIYFMINRKPILLRRVNVLMIIVIIVVVLYGLLLTLTPDSNPYVEFMRKEFTLPEYKKGALDGRLFGSISSVFNHPMAFGIMLGLSLCHVWFSRKYLGIKILNSTILTILILMCIIFCGVRSSIIALMGTCVVYLLLRHRFSLLLKTIVGIGIAIVIIYYLPGMKTYISSIFQMGNSEVAGSSVKLRLAQLEAGLFEIRGNLLFGNGYDWHSYYLFTHNFSHPKLLGWESLLLVALTDSGFVGVALWILFCVYFFIKHRHNIEIVCIFTYFMIYILATGSFGEDFFYVFYVLALCRRNLRLLNLRYYRISK